MKACESSCAPLAPTWAFVVQLREGTSFEPAELRGRVEHIATGRASEFNSLEEAHDFMRRTVAQLGSASG